MDRAILVTHLAQAQRQVGHAHIEVSVNWRSNSTRDEAEELPTAQL
jgi:hypothetical protein